MKKVCIVLLIVATLIASNGVADLRSDAEAGIPAAMNDYGVDLFNEGNSKEAEMWLLKAADGGIPQAYFNLGVLYFLQESYSNAMQWFKKAAQTGDKEAMANIAQLLLDGKGTNVSEEQAFTWFMKAAEAGLPDAMNTVGYMYEKGIGVTQDYEAALKWYMKSGYFGNDTGMLNTGLMFAYGRGVQQSDYYAYLWFVYAAEAGNAQAIANLSLMTNEPITEWLEYAAKKGNVSAMFKLGDAYLYGENVEKDTEKAVYWYKKAAKNGSSDAMFNLGIIYLEGLNGSVDVEEGLNWYVRAAYYGNTKAMYNIGYAFTKGEIVEKDYLQAYVWFQLAAKEGDETARKNADYLREKGLYVDQSELNAYIASVFERVKAEEKTGQYGEKQTSDLMKGKNTEYAKETDIYNKIADCVKSGIPFSNELIKEINELDQSEAQALADLLNQTNFETNRTVRVLGTEYQALFVSGISTTDDVSSLQMIDSSLGQENLMKALRNRINMDDESALKEKHAASQKFNELVDELKKNSDTGTTTYINLCVHGGTTGNKQFVIQFNDNPNDYMTVEDVLENISGIKGKIILFVNSCESKHFIEEAERLNLDKNKICIFTSDNSNAATIVGSFTRFVENAFNDVPIDYLYKTSELKEEIERTGKTESGLIGEWRVDSDGDGKVTADEMYSYIKIARSYSKTVEFMNISGINLNRWNAIFQYGLFENINTEEFIERIDELGDFKDIGTYGNLENFVIYEK